MTRKRFVKLLMSQGIGRNGANEFAQFTKDKGSYEKRYKAWKALNDLSNPLSGLGEAIQRATESVTKLVDSICAATRSFSSTLSVALQEPSPFGDVCPRCGGTGVEKRMQAMAQIGGPSVRGPDLFGICPQCFGTGRRCY